MREDRDGNAARSGRPDRPPPKYPLRETWNVIFYQSGSGCSWRSLPHDFPPYNIVWDHFWNWRNNDTVVRMLEATRRRVRAHFATYMGNVRRDGLEMMAGVASAPDNVCEPRRLVKALKGPIRGSTRARDREPAIARRQRFSFSVTRSPGEQSRGAAALFRTPGNGADHVSRPGPASGPS